MKKRLSKYEVIQRHTESDRIIEAVLMTSDHKINNREAKKIIRLSEALSKDIELAKEVYFDLLRHDCLMTKFHAACNCLKLNIFTSKAEEILNELSLMEGIGTLRFNAEMALRVWRGEIPGKHL